MSHVLTENLKRLRCEKRLTQEQVAQRLGVSPQAVSRWECATTLPDVMLLPELAHPLAREEACSKKLPAEAP